MSVKDVLLDKIKETGSHPFLFVEAGLTKRYLKGVTLSKEEAKILRDILNNMEL